MIRILAITSEISGIVSLFFGVYNLEDLNIKHDLCRRIARFIKSIFRA